jgi:hypothetical protein
VVLVGRTFPVATQTFITSHFSLPNSNNRLRHWLLRMISVTQSLLLSFVNQIRMETKTFFFLDLRLFSNSELGLPLPSLPVDLTLPYNMNSNSRDSKNWSAASSSLLLRRPVALRWVDLSTAPNPWISTMPSFAKSISIANTAREEEAPIISSTAPEVIAVLEARIQLRTILLLGIAFKRHLDL